MVATDVMPNIAKGPVAAGEGDLVGMIAAGAVKLWDAVIVDAAGSGEVLPRVKTTTTVDDRLIFGIVVDTFNLDTIAAGNLVLIQINGLSKVSTTAGAVTLGQGVSTSATAGQVAAQAAIAHAGTYSAADADIQEKKQNAVLGMALTPNTSTAADTIVVDLNRTPSN